MAPKGRKNRFDRPLKNLSPFGQAFEEKAKGRLGKNRRRTEKIQFPKGGRVYAKA